MNYYVGTTVQNGRLVEFTIDRAESGFLVQVIGRGQFAITALDDGEILSKINDLIPTPSPLDEYRERGDRLFTSRVAGSKTWAIFAGTSKGFEDTGFRTEDESEARRLCAWSTTS